MNRSSPPTQAAPTSDTGGFAIEIDPSLIDLALASVERATSRRSAKPAATLEEDAGVDLSLDISLEDGEPASPSAATVPPADDERIRLQVRVREQQATIQRLERDLARAAESRDAADKAGREARAAFQQQTADFDKYRARARKDVEEAERNGEDKVLRPVAEIYDNVDRAWTHAAKDPTQLLPGLQMIVDQFKRLLTRVGLERIPAERGTAFNPEIHEAVLHVPDDLVAPGTVVHEVHAGFRLRGRLFRPARVTVSAPPPGPDV